MGLKQQGDSLGLTHFHVNDYDEYLSNSRHLWYWEASLIKTLFQKCQLKILSLEQPAKISNMHEVIPKHDPKYLNTVLAHNSRSSFLTHIRMIFGNLCRYGSNLAIT
jgi:hypothetical protein